MHQAIIANDYKSIKTWNVLRFESILNMQLLYTLSTMNNLPHYIDSGYSVLNLIITTMANEYSILVKKSLKIIC